MANSWKLDGNCENCRRKNYCSKDCMARKRVKANEEQELKNQIANLMFKKIFERR